MTVLRADHDHFVHEANPFVPHTRIEPPYRAANEDLAGEDLRVVGGSYQFIMFGQPEAFTGALRAALAVNSKGRPLFPLGQAKRAAPWRPR